MGSCTRFRVTQHGVWLARELKNTLHNRPPDISLVCSDGPFGLHLAILAPRLSSHLSRLLKAHWMGGLSDEPVSVMLPDFSCQDVQSLASLLYTGSTGPITSDAVERLKDLTRLLKITSIPVSAVRPEEQETEEKPEPRIRAEIVKKVLPPDTEKQPNNKSPAVEEDADGGIRRSKRPRVKSKRLDDYDVGQLGAKAQGSGKADEHDTGPHSSDSTSHKTTTTTTKVIDNVAISVTAPNSKVYEVQSEQNCDGLPKAVIKHCQLCQRKFFGKYSFAQHLRTLHGDKSGPFACAKCNSSWANGIKLHEHYRLGHNLDTGTNICCPLCHQDFANREAYRDHCKAKHSEGGDKKRETFSCTVKGCTTSGVFSSFVAFRNHTLGAHKMFPLECTICGNRYKEQATLRNHMETHQGELKYPCDVCAKKFVTRERLFAHRRLHMGKRFTCSQCGFKGRSGSALRTHIQMKHQERRFQCVICAKRFASKQNCDIHERIHTGEAPWQCSLCSARFKRLHHFKHHLTTSAHAAKISEAKSSGKIVPAHLLVDQESNRQEIGDIDNTATNADGSGSFFDCDICPGAQVYKRDYHFAQHLRSKQHVNRVSEMRSKGLFVPDRLVPHVNTSSGQVLTDTQALVASLVESGGTTELSLAVPLTLETDLTSDHLTFDPAARIHVRTDMQPLSLVDQSGSDAIAVLSLDKARKFDEDLIDLADNAAAEDGFFLEYQNPDDQDNNVQLIIVRQDKNMMSANSADHNSQATLLTTSEVATDESVVDDNLISISLEQ